MLADGNDPVQALRKSIDVTNPSKTNRIRRIIFILALVNLKTDRGGTIITCQDGRMIASGRFLAYGDPD